MNKKRKYVILFGVLGVAVVLTAVLLFMIFGSGYRSYAGKWELEKWYVYNEKNGRYEEMSLGGTRHVYNKDTDKYDVTKAKKNTFNIDEAGNYIQTGSYGEQDKGKLKKHMGKVYCTGKCQFGNFRWDFERSGDKFILYESVDSDSADDSALVLATKVKYVYARK